MNGIPADLRRFVVRIAKGRCEYCGLSQQGQEATFHLDHIIPRRDGGLTTRKNLGLSCVSCSLRKGARSSAIDPKSGKEVLLYNPRKNSWKRHFRWKGVELVGLTGTGRATIVALQMNRPLIKAIRWEEALLGRHPPPEY